MLIYVYDDLREFIKFNTERCMKTCIPFKFKKKYLPLITYYMHKE